jgi:hypothetical protein
VGLLLCIAKKTGDYPTVNKRNNDYGKHDVLLAKEEKCSWENSL